MLGTKIDGFLATTHLWAGEAVYANEPLRIVYVSSRQAIDPGPSVPGYAVSNWAVLQLPDVLAVNLGKAASLVSATLDPAAVRAHRHDRRATPRTPRCSAAGSRACSRPTRPPRRSCSCCSSRAEVTDRGMFELMVEAARRREGVDVTWKQVHLDLREEPLGWSADTPLRYS